MVIEIQQITRRGEVTYKAVANGRDYADIYMPWEERSKDCYFTFFGDDRKYKFVFGNPDVSVFKDPAARVTMRIFENEKEVGGIVSDEACVSKERKHGEMGWYHATFYGQKYETYIACVPKEEDYFCVFDQTGVRVGEVRRTRAPYNEFDYYVVFTEDEELAKFLCMIAIHLDIMKFYNMGEMDDELYTYYGHKDGLRYHDASYVARIAAESGFDLSKKVDKELIKNAKVSAPQEAMLRTKAGKKTHWTIYIVFLVIFLLLFIPRAIHFFSGLWQVLH
jgi:hypothetical protein